MKKTTLLIFIGLTLGLAACSSATPGKVMPYSFDTAKVEYKISGDLTGNMTGYIKGDNSVNKISATTSKDNQTMSNVTITLGETIYFIDLVNKQGWSSKNYIYSELQGLGNDEKLKKLLSYATNSDPQAELKSEGEREYAGQKCQVYNIANGEVCMWQGVPIYSKQNINGEDRMIEATNIQTGIDIAEEEFRLPEGIVIEDVTKMIQ